MLNIANKIKNSKKKLKYVTTKEINLKQSK